MRLHPHDKSAVSAQREEEAVDFFPNSSLSLLFSPVDGRWFRFFCFCDVYWQLATQLVLFLVCDLSSSESYSPV